MLPGKRQSQWGYPASTTDSYEEVGQGRHLCRIIIACIPNGSLQDKYNPTPGDTIWLAGRDAPTLGEDFRVRLSYKKLRDKAAWRVQEVEL